MKLMKSQA